MSVKNSHNDNLFVYTHTSLSSSSLSQFYELALTPFNGDSSNSPSANGYWAQLKAYIAEWRPLLNKNQKKIKCLL